VPRWIAQCESLRRKGMPHARDIAILFQMIVGAWPLDLDQGDAKGRRAFADRLAQWQEKALREAKLETDWSVPNEPYESAARELLMALVSRDEKPALLGELVTFANRIGPAGAVNGLAQTLLKFTVPGIPDIYQGADLWDFSLVDPDNRRPVDFASRMAPAAQDVGDLATHWRDGRIKQRLITRALAVRRRRPELFTQGQYEPLEVTGEHAGRVIAFARRWGASVAVTVVPRAASRMLRADSIAFDAVSWANSSIALQHKTPLIDAFSTSRVAYGDEFITLTKLFHTLPFALLVTPDLAQ
jgi:(1->4)-alpha-D-glucan 1-alpha-D-glucosylmutase